MTTTDAASELRGLSAAEVDERVALGRVNAQPSQTSRTYSGIIRANVLTRFNLILSIMAVVVLSVGELPDALFALVVVANTSIGIVQEVRAKRTLDRVRLLVSPVVTVRRDSRSFEVPPDEVVLDDLIEFGAGDQVAVDAEMLEGDGLEVDESALTGESDPVVKLPGDEVLSGSVVISGGGVGIARRVGEDAGIYRLVEQAKAFELATSELRSGIDQVLRIVGWLIVPLGALLLWSQLRSNDSVDDALISAVAGVIGLVPQGLILLVSMALAVAVIRLSKDHVVVQELHAVEGLARITMFCVDKTGTLTTGSMQVDSMERLGEAAEGDGAVDVRRALASLALADPNPNRTLRVIADSVEGAETWTAIGVVPFSSARKWSGAMFRSGGEDTTWVLGAPEILLERVEPEERPPIDALIERATLRAQRVVLLATGDGDLADQALPPRLAPRSLITLSEQVRDDAAETMAYFRQQGVTVKVISGDHPATVSAVAEHIELPGADRCVDMRTVDIDDRDVLDAVVAESVVFGRVLPEQKRAIVESLQRAGERVAMTGDGVNDIPALKRADIGVAVDTATPATKAVSQLVLLDGRFDRMPNVVGEGRRVIYNMERVSALFLTKTVYAALFALAIGLSGSVFPFLPRQMSLVSELTIGIPAFALSFRSADAPCRPGYLERVLRFAVPAGVVTGSVTLVAYWLARSDFGGATLDQSRSASTLALVLFGFWILTMLMRPIDRLDLGLLLAMLAAFALVLMIEPLRDFYLLERPPAKVVATTLGTVALGIGAWALVVGSRRHINPG
ncbi:HAD-IC family P-type ATPase [Ilumatobacter sp.]|uniref:HAD-IC family P-type ATPase n=1 Tax=Ilumatobacter sp. TaxID=1967498 RepID=UPI003AF736F4